MNILDGVCGDVRTPDKLVDSVCEAGDGRHMWLAPILPGVVSVYKVHDHLVFSLYINHMVAKFFPRCLNHMVVT